jgi:hypothetical protein
MGKIFSNKKLKNENCKMNQWMIQVKPTPRAHSLPVLDMSRDRSSRHPCPWPWNTATIFSLYGRNVLQYYIAKQALKYLMRLQQFIIHLLLRAKIFYPRQNFNIFIISSY